MDRKAQRAKIEKRRRDIAANLLAGLNYRQIAEGLQVSLGTVASDVKAIFKRWKDETIHDADNCRTLDLARIDIAINAIIKDVEAGQLGAIDRLVRLLERRARMIGYDSPEKIDLNDSTKDPNEMSDEELAAIAAGHNPTAGGS